MNAGAHRVITVMLAALAAAACGRQPAQTASQPQPRTADAPAVGSAIPAKWVEGKNYRLLVPAQATSAASGKVEVLEMFWYGSDRCFRLEPALEDWRRQGQPEFVEFERVPVMSNDATRAHARLFYALEALADPDQLHSAVFREIHVNGGYFLDINPVTAERLQQAFLKTKGVPEEDFDRAYRSASVESKLQRAEQLTRRYKVTDTPVIVVNGKYTADVDSAGGENQLLELINDLAASERKP